MLLDFTYSKILFPSLFYFTFLSLAAQTQIGNDIDGTAANDWSGHSLSLSADGNRVAIGAPRHSDSAMQAGQVSVYELTTNDWTLIDSPINGEAENDQSGFSVSLSDDGNRVAIGSPFNDGNNDNSGQVRVYEFTNGSWTQLGIDIEGQGSNSQSGYSVSLSGNGSRLAIGAPSKSDIGNRFGQVRIYELTNGDWVQLGGDLNGVNEFDFFGWSVALSKDGHRVAIGGTQEGGSASNLGLARIFEFTNGNWVQLGSDLNGDATGDSFGYSVSLAANGNRVAVGAPFNDGNSNSSGQVKVYEYDNGNWTSAGEEILGENSFDQAGWSVALSADGIRVAIGARQNSGFANNSGHVRLFELTSEDWIQVGDDIDGEAADDRSGWAVTLSENGNRVAVGALWNDDAGNNAGHVRIYDMEPVSVNFDIAQNNLHAFPNPTAGKISVAGDNFDYNQIQVLDILGNIVQTISFPVKELDLSELSPGVYFLWTNSKNGKASFIDKIIKY